MQNTCCKCLLPVLSLLLVVFQARAVAQCAVSQVNFQITAASLGVTKAPLSPLVVSPSTDDQFMFLQYITNSTSPSVGSVSFDNPGGGGIRMSRNAAGQLVLGQVSFVKFPGAQVERSFEAVGASNGMTHEWTFSNAINPSRSFILCYGKHTGNTFGADDLFRCHFDATNSKVVVEYDANIQNSAAVNIQVVQLPPGNSVTYGTMAIAPGKFVASVPAGDVSNVAVVWTHSFPDAGSPPKQIGNRMVSCEIIGANLECSRGLSSGSGNLTVSYFLIRFDPTQAKVQRKPLDFATGAAAKTDSSFDAGVIAQGSPVVITGNIWAETDYALDDNPGEAMFGMVLLGNQVTALRVPSASDARCIIQLITFCIAGATTTPATGAPTPAATAAPTSASTGAPTRLPSKTPTKIPTQQPTSKQPSKAPTSASTGAPTRLPSKTPTKIPTQQPTSKQPSKAPTSGSPTTKSPTSVSPTLSAGPTSLSPTSLAHTSNAPTSLVPTPTPGPPCAFDALPGPPRSRFSVTMDTPFPLFDCAVFKVELSASLSVDEARLFLVGALPAAGSTIADIYVSGSDAAALVNAYAAAVEEGRVGPMLGSANILQLTDSSGTSRKPKEPFPIPIVAGAVGGLLLLLIVVGVVIMIKKRRDRAGYESFSTFNEGGEHDYQAYVQLSRLSV